MEKSRHSRIALMAVGPNTDPFSTGDTVKTLFAFYRHDTRIVLIGNTADGLRKADVHRHDDALRSETSAKGEPENFRRWQYSRAVAAGKDDRVQPARQRRQPLRRFRSPTACFMPPPSKDSVSANTLLPTRSNLGDRATSAVLAAPSIAFGTVCRLRTERPR